MTEKWTFCPPPIWDRKYCRYSTSTGNFSSENQFPAPDWGSVGPVLNYKDENKTGIEFKKKIVRKASLSFFPIKNTSTECCISRASPCAIPINNLKTVDQNFISNSSFKSKLKSDVQNKSGSLGTGLKYGGDNEDKSMRVNGFNGRIDALEIQGENFIVHPEWRERKQWIVVSSIKAEKSYALNSPSEELEENIVFRKTADIFASDNICQISSKSVGGIGFALLRTEKNASLVVLNGDLDNRELKSTLLNSGCWTVCSSLSSDVAGLWSVISEDGTVEVHPVEGPQIWGTHLREDSHIGQLRWYECEFGHHPMSLLIAGRSNLFLADLRTAGSRRDNLSTSQRNIFKTENMASFIDPNEQICTFKKCDKNPHVYAVLNKTVLMFDVRHCKVPCMKWQHMMPSMRPNYASTINIDGQNECLILGSKDQQNVCLLSGMWEQEDNESRYCAVGMPHHVNLIRDTAELMHKRGVLFSAAADTRLRTNMIGMVPVNLTNGKEFHLLTINSPCDLISQKFMYNRKEEFREVPQSAVEAWKSWEESISSVNLDTSESISNSQSKDVVLLDVTRFLYDNKSLVKKEDNKLTGLPPVICNWNVSEKIENAKERIAIREERGKHHGRLGNVSMNKILMKNYQNEPEYSKDTIKLLKDKHMVDKVDMTDIIRNLPRSVVNSLSNEGLHQFKDSLSLSVLSRWKSSNSNKEEQEKIKRRRYSQSDAICVQKTQKEVNLEKSKQGMFIVSNEIKSIRRREKNKIKSQKNIKSKVECLKILKEKKCKKSVINNSTLIINCNYNNFNIKDTNVLDQLKVNSWKENSDQKNNTNTKNISYSENVGMNHNTSPKTLLNLNEKNLNELHIDKNCIQNNVGKKEVRNKKCKLFENSENSEKLLTLKNLTNKDISHINSKENSKVAQDIIYGVHKENQKHCSKIKDVRIDKEKVLKGITKSSKKCKVILEDILKRTKGCKIESLRNTNKEIVLKNVSEISKEHKIKGQRFPNKENLLKYLSKSSKECTIKSQRVINKDTYLKDVSKSSKECKDTRQRIAIKEKVARDKNKRKENSSSQVKKENNITPKVNSRRRRVSVTNRCLKNDIQNHELSAKMGTLKYLKQRENFIKSHFDEFKNEDDLFASKSMNKSSIDESLVESQSLNDSMIIYTPDHKNRKSERSPTTPRTEVLAEWTETGIDPWDISTNNNVTREHKNMVTTVTYHLQQTTKGKNRNRSSIFAKLNYGEKADRHLPIVCNPIDLPLDIATNYDEDHFDEQPDEYFNI